MASFIWGRDPEEAFESPYEHGAQAQFLREGSDVLLGLYRLMNIEEYRFTLNDKSRSKAVWLLSIDALDALRHSICSLERKEQRIAGRLFRDVTESLDLATYFFCSAPEGEDKLSKWYNDEVVPHRIYRGYLRRALGETAQQASRDDYVSLSRFTHRSYRAILDGYTRVGNELIHDGSGALFGEDGAEILVPAQTIASYMAFCSVQIIQFSRLVVQFGLVSPEAVADAFQNAFEDQAEPRRFLPRSWFHEALGKQSP